MIIEKAPQLLSSFIGKICYNQKEKWHLLVQILWLISKFRRGNCTLTGIVSLSNVFNKSITYTSSNPDVVEILSQEYNSADGTTSEKIIERKPGTVTITATTGERSFTDDTTVTAVDAADKYYDRFTKNNEYILENYLVNYIYKTIFTFEQKTNIAKENIINFPCAAMLIKN